MMRKKRWVCLALAVIIAICSVTAVAGEYLNGYEAGRLAAKADHSGLAQFTGGFFLGILYVGYAVLAPSPGPPTWRIQEITAKPDDYQRGFLEGYEKMWRSQRSVNALTGALSGAALVYLLVFSLY